MGSAGIETERLYALLSPMGLQADAYSADAFVRLEGRFVSARAQGFSRMQLDLELGPGPKWEQKWKDGGVEGNGKKRGDAWEKERYKNDNEERRCVGGRRQGRGGRKRQ